ncbi:MAG TPA: glycerophosphodiester phosphodiesterase [Acidimicrobiales bacterium]|nr:glycerophosphodiester phosphodiesterase [Acidimicrobiales bacterium]
MYRPPGHVPLVLGHRGASADAPENTLASFDLAREQGADGVELDVRRSADGRLVLHHDAALPDGRVVARTASADLPVSVPTLAEALDTCAGLLVNVEIKNSPFDPDHDPERTLADDVVALLRARGGQDRVIVSSFDLATVDRVKELDGAVATGFLTFIDPLGPESVQLAVDRGHDAVHPHEGTVDAAFVTFAHDLGLAVNVWTVDDADRIRTLAGFGVDGIVTNVPAQARAALRAARG